MTYQQALQTATDLVNTQMLANPTIPQEAVSDLIKEEMRKIEGRVVSIRNKYRGKMAPYQTKESIQKEKDYNDILQGRY